MTQSIDTFLINHGFDGSEVAEIRYAVSSIQS